MKEKRKEFIVGIVVIMVLAMAGIGGYFWYQSNHYISTEDARVSTDLISVTPKISGKLLELNVKEGDTVIKNQILACQEMNNLPETSVEQALVRAPIDGVVAKAQGTVGAMYSVGQTMFTLVDPANIYISANIEETKISKVQVGQMVDFTIDSLGAQKFTGKVMSVGEVANSALSMIPSSTSSTFTKVVQRIAIKISIDDTLNKKLLPGANAVIKIHIK